MPRPRRRTLARVLRRGFAGASIWPPMIAAVGVWRPRLAGASVRASVGVVPAGRFAGRASSSASAFAGAAGRLQMRTWMPSSGSLATVDRQGAPLCNAPTVTPDLK